MVRSLTVVAALLAAAPLAAQASMPITIRTSMDQFDAEHATYSGNVTVAASLCHGVSYNVPVPFSGAKDGEEARRQTASAVAKLVGSIRQAASRCR